MAHKDYTNMSLLTEVTDMVDAIIETGHLGVKSRSEGIAVMVRAYNEWFHLEYLPKLKAFEEERKKGFKGSSFKAD